MIISVDRIALCFVPIYVVRVKLFLTEGFLICVLNFIDDIGCSVSYIY